MSMNLFLKSFTGEQIDAMKRDHSLIDAWVLNEKTYLDSTDTETAWDVLQNVLDGCGFANDAEIDDVLFNGCYLMSPALVKKQAAELADWTGERVAEALMALDPEADLYHLEVWQDEDGQDDLLDQFAQFKAFFIKAADNGWGMLSYLA